MENKKKLLLGKSAVVFSVLCCIVYFVSYMTRNDYGAVLVEITKDLEVSKDAASIALVGSFITYGAGQLLTGWLGDRIQPKYIIGVGLLGTSVINVAMTFLPNITAMTVFWCFNGLFQAAMWPPLVRMMAENLSPTTYTKTVTCVSTAASVATVAEYLIASAVVKNGSWRTVFAISATCGVLFALVWLIFTRGLRSELSPKKKDGEPSAPSRGKYGSLTAAFISSGAVTVMLAIVTQGTLRDGITTWMPTYIDSVFDLGSSLSILTAIFLPIFGIASISLATFVYSKIKNELTVAAIFFGIAALAGFVMLPFKDSNVIVSIIMMAVITGSMHGINHILLCFLPPRFISYGRVSSVSGLLNSCTYVGSALSTYGFAVILERYESIMVLTWACLAALGVILCALCIRRWKRFRDSEGV